MDRDARELGIEFPRGLLSVGICGGSETPNFAVKFEDGGNGDLS